MKINTAFDKSIKAFLAGKMKLSMEEHMEDGLVFTPEYFDELEKELVAPPPLKKGAKNES